MLVSCFATLAFRAADLVSIQVLPAVRYRRGSGSVPAPEGDSPPEPESPPNIPPRLELTFTNRHKLQVHCDSQADALYKFARISGILCGDSA